MAKEKFMKHRSYYRPPKNASAKPSAVCALHLRTLIIQVLFSAYDVTAHYLLQQNPWNYT
jgi:hypothetical protein